jgi:antitoxin (DNA-binding transcriptional repressor) of toxin-antitoxin stability system
MRQVGIRELKSKLSEYVRQAAAGEIIEVTERGRVVAQLRAPGPIVDEYPYPLLLKAASEGKVVMPKARVSPEAYSSGLTPSANETALRLLDELRGEG